MSPGPVYEHDPDSRPDDEFEAGTLAHLVAGNRGRLLDGRRTPVVLTGLVPEAGMFELEIAAFEDAGARWQIELERVDRFQFEPGGPRLDDVTVSELAAAVARLDATTTIPAAAAERGRTEQRIAALCGRAAECVSDAAPAEALEGYLDDLGLEEMDAAFAARWVSNPASGELVKGHAIVLARLGLCPYRGKIPRSPDLFAGDWSEERRGAHVVARLAFTRTLFASLGHERVVLFRGTAAEEPLRPPEPRSFLSATFDRRVAEAHFAGSPRTVAAALYRQSVPVERLFMTHVETRAFSRQFRESEAVLVGDPTSPLF